MNREVHVRFWESLGVRFPWATQLGRGWTSGLIADARRVVLDSDEITCATTPDVPACEDEATLALVQNLHSSGVIAKVERYPTLARLIAVEAVRCLAE